MTSTNSVVLRRRFLGLFTASTITPAHFLYASDRVKADVITIGGAITEIAFALGQGDRIVARDTTSSYPADAAALPDVGYMRQLSAEGVLSFAPSLIVAQEGAGPPEVIDILKAARVPFVEVPSGYDRNGVIEKIKIVGDALGVPEDAKKLAEKLNSEMLDAEENSFRSVQSRKRVLFILSMQGGRVMASGTGTGADGIIRMAGGQNAISEFDGYKPMSDEAVTASAPDVILMMNRSGDHASTDDELFSLPALNATPAAESQSVIRMNGLYLLGFGPRTAKAIVDLHQALYEKA